VSLNGGSRRSALGARHFLRVGIIVVAACSSSGDGGPTRSYRMGFSDFPPRFTQADYDNALAAWLPRADAAIIHVSPPWTALIGGATPESAVTFTQLPLANLYHARGLKLFVTIDATDGLNRAADAPELVALGRSISEPAIQQLYRRYVVAFDTLAKPDYLGLAAETNLIRLAAPATLYNGLVAMTNAAAADVRAVDAATPLYVSVQVEAAWGRLGGPVVYAGVERDFIDFPFVNSLGLSSYPYLGGFTDPADIPDDYYARLPNGRTIPMMVVEGGWASASAGGFTSDPAKQAQYLRRQSELLESVHAVALFQLTFADIDTTGLHLPPTSIIPLFASLGVVDSDLHPKPALAVWDSLFALPRAH
jgi:hypothetical protein